MAKSGEQSTLTVVLAMAANVAVGIAKLIAGLLTGSAAMLSEAAHSLGDTVNEVLLLTALRRSNRPADREHPFGYGKERYFWSLLAAVSIFAAGAMFSIYQGFATLLRPPENQRDVTIGFVVLAAAFVLEGISLAQAIRQVRHEKHKDHLGLLAYLRRTDDPTVTIVLFEDSAALVGLLLAAAGLGLTHLTGTPIWDGIASLAIGGLLIGVAYGLGRTNLGLLVGRQADPRLVHAIADHLHAQPEVEVVVDLLTMLTGTDQVLVCARLDFTNTATSDEIELACVRIDTTLREEFTDLHEIFLAPIPRTDPGMHDRVQARYGDQVAVVTGTDVT